MGGADKAVARMFEARRTLYTRARGEDDTGDPSKKIIYEDINTKCYNKYMVSLVLENMSRKRRSTLQVWKCSHGFSRTWTTGSELIGLQDDARSIFCIYLDVIHISTLNKRLYASIDVEARGFPFSKKLVWRQCMNSKPTDEDNIMKHGVYTKNFRMRICYHGW